MKKNNSKSSKNIIPKLGVPQGEGLLKNLPEPEEPFKKFNLIQIVKKRLEGEGGDSVIQLQTPFGGGKTHSLIALFHKAKDWNARTFIFVGDKLNPNNTIIWEEFEEQITGKIDLLKGKTVPSGESIREILKQNQPIMILLDELIEYLIPSRGIKIENTTLDSQILAFIKRLAEVAGSLEKTIFQIILNLLNERLGRVEKTFTPVEDHEVTHIVRRRLFSEINEKKIKDIVYEVVEYFKAENILPLGIEPSIYKDKFLVSYPFIPDVIECLFHKWGSFPNFQRTRGVLRFLSLAIYCLREKNIEYITLGDFDLKYQDLRRELIKNIGNEYDSIIAADITDKNSGSKKVDNSLGESYKGLHIGTRSSTAIFLYSFSTGRDNGANLKEIKRSSTITSIPSSIVSEAIDLLKTEKLFYVEEQAGKILFKNTPNLNKIIRNKIENVEDNEILTEEKKYLISSVKKGNFNKIYIWPAESKDIDDNPHLKLIILDKRDKNFMNSIVENKGTVPRVYRNTLFFLSPLETKRFEFLSSIKRRIALEQIQKDASLKLKQQEKQNISDSIKKQKEIIMTKINETYRTLNIPARNEIEDMDLGIPTYGDSMNLTKDVYEKLKSEGTIIEKMVPLVVKVKYLKGKDYVSTKNIHDNSLKTLGENRLLNESVLKNSIINGVKQGLFGLGTLEKEEIIPIYWKVKCQVGFSDNEILIIPNICEEYFKNKEEEFGEREKEEKEEQEEGEKGKRSEKKKKGKVIKKEISKINIPKFILPKGKVSSLLGLLNYIQTKFEKIQIKIEASEGGIDEGEYQDNIKEALKQIGIDIK